MIKKDQQYLIADLIKRKELIFNPPNQTSNILEMVHSETYQQFQNQRTEDQT